MQKKQIVSFTIIGLLLVVPSLFFLYYNKFLISHSVKALEVSLESIAQGELEGIDDLVGSYSKKAVVEGDEADVARYDYITTTFLLGRESMADVESLLDDLLGSEKGRRSKALRILDAITIRVTRAFTYIKNTIVSFGRRSSDEELSSSLERAVTLFKDKRFKAAEKLLKEIIIYGRGTTFAKLAEVYRERIRQHETLLKKEKKILKVIAREKNPVILQRLYYNLASLHVETDNYEKAGEYFLKAIRYLPESTVAQRAYISYAYLNKISGNLERAREILDEFLKNFPDSAFIIYAKLQIADILRREKDLAAARYYYALAEEFRASRLSPLVLFQAACIYNFDLGKRKEAFQILAGIIEDYPASRPAQKIDRVFLEETIEQKLDIKDRLILAIWKTAPPFKQVMNLVEKGSVWYALYMIEGTIEQALQQEKRKGDLLTIERDSQFLTEWVKERIDVFLENLEDYDAGLEDFAISFPRRGWILTQGVVSLQDKSWNSYVLGKMYLKRQEDFESEVGEEYSRKKWVVYEVTEARMGKINVPTVVINEALKKAYATFNKQQVFDIENMVISPTIGIWEGEVLYDRQTLKKKLEELEEYKKLIR